jgi:hypothetical protein
MKLSAILALAMLSVASSQATAESKNTIETAVSNMAMVMTVMSNCAELLVVKKDTVELYYQLRIEPHMSQTEFMVAIQPKMKEPLQVLGNIGRKDFCVMAYMLYGPTGTRAPRFLLLP